MAGRFEVCLSCSRFALISELSMLKNSVEKLESRFTNRQAIEEYPPTQAFHRARREAQDVAGEVYVVRPELDHCASPEAAGGILLFSNAADGPAVPRS